MGPPSHTDPRAESSRRLRTEDRGLRTHGATALRTLSEAIATRVLSPRSSVLSRSTQSEWRAFANAIFPFPFR
jgi:hypothetical protein